MEDIRGRVSPRVSRADVHTTTETVAVYIRLAQLQARWGPRSERKLDTLIPNQEAIQMTARLPKRVSFLLWSLTGVQITFKGRPGAP